MTAEVWMGYLVDHQHDFTVVQSPFVLEQSRVFGADSDATTLTVAGLLHRLNHEPISSLGVPEGIDADTLAAACNVHVQGEEDEGDPPWDVLLSDEATVVIVRQGAEVELSHFDVEIAVDPEFHTAMEAAWQQELNAAHVSQGAYVSKSQYEEAAKSRLTLEGQHGAKGVVWPPRYSSGQGDDEVKRHLLSPSGTVQSWTTLSAAGAPSEFALRAPLLGGISTVMLELHDGPKGVFLTVDDEEPTLDFGLSMELVLRRIYAQEGFVRYGLKARTIQD